MILSRNKTKYSGRFDFSNEKYQQAKKLIILWLMN